MLRQINSVLARQIFLCLSAAILIICSFPAANIEIFAWFSFVPLFFALKDKTRLQAFLLSYFTGIIFWSGSIWWLAHVTLAGTILLILYLALYFGLFGLIITSTEHPACRSGRRAPSTGWLFIPSLWVLLEYLRAYLLTGFPWALLGYSQYLNLPVIQIADITGVWGVSFLVMLVNVVIAQVLDSRFWVPGQKETKIKLKILASFFLLLSLSLAYGYYKLNLIPITPACPAGRQHLTPVKISVIQPNIPQDLKWERSSRDYIISRYVDLTHQASQDKPDLIIWPEAALPVVLEEEPVYYEIVKDLVRKIKIPLVLGAVTLRDKLYYNSSLLVSADGQTSDIYDKLHLVPFGEYIPLRKALSFLETIAPIGDITPGKEFRVFLKPARFSVLICFEDLFPEISRRFVREGAGFLVNITNDAWYKKTSAAYQHLQASVLRAVENRVFLLRSANTGVSGFIHPTGKIISLVQGGHGENIFVSGYRTENVFVNKEGVLSFYSRFGDIFILLLFIFSLYHIFRFIRLKKLP